jgi:hypothetical protein
MKRNILVVSVLLFAIGCSSYVPFESNKKKRVGLKYIKDSLDLTKQEYQKLHVNDSLLYIVSKSIKDKKTDKTKIKKRLDSFFLNKYDRNQLWIILELDRNFSTMNFNFLRDDGRKMLDFSNMEEFTIFMNKLKKRIDKPLRIDILVKKDSLIRINNEDEN